MYTKNGKAINNLTFIDGIGYIGEVEGKKLVWDVDGRRSKTNCSPLDICNSKKFYVNLRRWGNEIKLDSRLYPSKITAEKNAKNGHFKTVQIEL